MACIARLLACIGPLLAVPAQACDYCLLNQGLSPLQTQRGVGVRVGQRYTRLDEVYEGSDEVPNPGVEEEYWTTEVSGFYSVNDRLMLLVTAPLRHTEGDGEVEEEEGGDLGREDVTGDATGLGDVSLLARYTMASHHTLDATTLVAGVLGVKLPTGSTNERGDQGEYLDSHLQLGTGSTDLLVGLSLDHARGRVSVSANVLASFAGEGETGDASHEFGDSLNYDVTAKARLTPSIIGQSSNAYFVSLGVNGELRDREHLDGRRIDDSGGHTIYLTPGVQGRFEDHWVIEAAYQHAIYRHLNEVQLGERYRIFANVTYLF
jgi:hypothetical protein